MAILLKKRNLIFQQVEICVGQLYKLGEETYFYKFSDSNGKNSVYLVLLKQFENLLITPRITSVQYAEAVQYCGVLNSLCSTDAIPLQY